MNVLHTHIPLFIAVGIGLSFVFSLAINGILLKFSENLGAREQAIQKQVRWNSQIKPSVGGISFFVIFLLAFIVLSFINNLLPLHYNNIKIIGVFSVCTIAFIMGLADDAYNTNPLLKFTTQLMCGLILYFTGTKIIVFPAEALNFLFTIVWVVGLMNSINMLDNMDGITTIVSIVILFFIILLNLNLSSILTPMPILCLGVTGSLLGFLVYNWHPSKMFMGDTGSQFLGCFLAVVGIDYCWNWTTLAGAITWLSINSVTMSFCIVALVFILPLTDTITVTINRILKGRSPFIGGKDHTTHHLFFKGMSEKKIAILFFIIGLIGISLALIQLLNYRFHWVVISVIFCVITFICLYINTIIKIKR